MEEVLQKIEFRLTGRSDRQCHVLSRVKIRTISK